MIPDARFGAVALEGRLCVAAGAFACSSILLGLAVARRPPTRVDLSGYALRGQGVRAAFIFTLLGRWRALLALSALSVGVSIASGAALSPALVVVGTQAVSQLANSLLKFAFARPRPYEYIGHKERESAYPSGHATTAVVFFLGFAILTLQAALPPILSHVLALGLFACALGIPWSRLALGAHFVSDVVGGVLIGSAWLCAAFALLLRVFPAAVH